MRGKIVVDGIGHFLTIVAIVFHYPEIAWTTSLLRRNSRNCRTPEFNFSGVHVVYFT